MSRPAGAVLSGADEVRAQALEVAGGWSPPGAPSSWRLTAALFEAIAADDELVGQLTVLPPDRLPALLASAAVAFLVRRDRPDPLASYFPEPGESQPRSRRWVLPGVPGVLCCAPGGHHRGLPQPPVPDERGGQVHPDRPGHRGGQRRIRRPGGPGGSGYRGRAWGCSWTATGTGWGRPTARPRPG